MLDEVLVDLGQWNLSNELSRVEALEAVDLDKDGYLSIREALVIFSLVGEAIW